MMNDTSLCRRRLCTDDMLDVALVQMRMETIKSIFAVGDWDRGEMIGPLWPSLMPLARDSDHRGLSAKFGDITVMSYAIAGRVLITFHRGDDWISFCAADGYAENPGPGLQGIGATINDALKIVADAARQWDVTKFEPDTEVHIAGF